MFVKWQINTPLNVLFHWEGWLRGDRGASGVRVQGFQLKKAKIGIIEPFWSFFGANSKEEFGDFWEIEEIHTFKGTRRKQGTRWQGYPQGKKGLWYKKLISEKWSIQKQFDVANLTYTGRLRKNQLKGADPSSWKIPTLADRKPAGQAQEGSAENWFWGVQSL